MSDVKRFKLLIDFMALSGGQFFSKLIGFLGFAYLARILTPESYGVVEYAVGLSLFFAMIIDCGLGAIGVREVLRAPEKLKSLAAHIPAARLIIALAAIPLMGGAVMLGGYDEATVNLVWLFALGLLAVPAKQEWLLQSYEMMKSAAMAQTLRMTVFALCLFVFVGSADDLLKVGVAEIIAAALVSVYYLGIQHFRITPLSLNFSLAELGRLTRNGLSVGLSNMVWAVIQFSPLFLVANLVGGAETAWFGAAHRIVVSLMTFSWVYHFNLYPAIARRVEKSTESFEELVSASFRVVSWVGVLGALNLSLLAQPLLTLAFGEQFSPAAPAFAILIWVVPTTLLAGHARWALIAAGRERYVLYSQLSGAITVLILGFALVPMFHALGAAVSMLIASLVVWLSAHTFAVRFIGRLPGLSLAWLPLAIAFLSGVLGALAGSSIWMGAVIASAVYGLCALLADAELLPDLRRLAHAKSEI